METISLKQLSISEKTFLLQELGYQTDGKFVLNKNGEIARDVFVDVPVKFDNMLILPGSTIILDDNELSLSMYLEEYGDSF